MLESKGCKMVTIVKHEWHQHDRQYAYEIDEDILSLIYPELDEDEIAAKLKEIEEGDIDVEEIINDAYENDVDIDWDFQYDDCWTDRKGGYEVTYELGDEDSWVEPQKDPEPTHKCTKCKWVGQSYDADWVYSDVDSEEPQLVCPMCEHDTELTEVGKQEEKEREDREASWAQEEKDSNHDSEGHANDLPASWPFDRPTEGSGQEPNENT